MKNKIILLLSVFINVNISAKTVFIFSHGLEGNRNQIKRYTMPNKLNWQILGNNNISFDFGDVDSDGKFNENNANLAQDKDVETLDNIYKECLKDEAVNKIVLVGVSRGASTIINYASRHPEKLAAVVLESPFDSIEKIIEYQLNRKYVGWIPGIKHLFHKIIERKYPNYDKNGIRPIDIVKSLPKNLPILFVHSKKDRLIPIKSSIRLYKQLKSTGHNNVYLLKLNDGEHASYQWGTDANNYQTVVHAFYKKHDIEHIEELAQLGERLLEASK
ncbi:alpha/beta hydrolase [Candidatus Babela massiliensis]|uniref:Alpha/beta superfamily hydrolase n=1 Tax=Candidatus Babela massiliensis TaxID=673862 RepID=V6DJ89_9BACT|nr:alpha/beta fold hydrolase [Candidatus Babela massiliensis]CDK30576.1 alpha/beta superfamily hydrolase [Candidatus Babela massiliensis]